MPDFFLGDGEIDIALPIVGDEAGMADGIEEVFDRSIFVIAIEEADSVQEEMDMWAASSASCASAFSS